MNRFYMRPEPQPDPIRPLHERSQIYLQMLSLLELEPRHYENLRRRGLSDDMIRGNMYAVSPPTGKMRRQVTEAAGGTIRPVWYARLLHRGLPLADGRRPVQRHTAPPFAIWIIRSRGCKSGWTNRRRKR